MLTAPHRATRNANDVCSRDKEGGGDSTGANGDAAEQTTAAVRVYRRFFRHLTGGARWIPSEQTNAVTATGEVFFINLIAGIVAAAVLKPGGRRQTAGRETPINKGVSGAWRGMLFMAAA